MTLLKGRDYIETQDFTKEEIHFLLDQAKDLKAKFHRGDGGAGHQYAVRRGPPDADTGRPDDHSRSIRGRPARAEDRGELGVFAELCQAAVGAARADHPDDAIWDGCGAGAPAGVQVDG